MRPVGHEERLSENFGNYSDAESFGRTAAEFDKDGVISSAAYDFRTNYSGELVIYE